ncbi:MAG: tRNA preQ1(34) S-adenosylmethionine ribosyltransferase-isomerase QueA [Gammaproteobacteria bacterium]|nr:tRNA preQ1(34) S-adenosylmethionine ribosyltransferase-isomerase QueA [Gammaproteobacteria bacterium]
MKTSDFSFTLPNELIAQYPSKKRTASRLFCVDRQTGVVQHQQFPQLLNYLNAGDVLVCNDTKVIPARLYGKKSTGGNIEVLVERVLNKHEVLAQVRASHAPKVGAELLLEEKLVARVIARQDDLLQLSFGNNQTVFQWLEQLGHFPLPPYIEHQDGVLDKERYQTVYAQKKGAVAAPTAGLHFDNDLFAKIKQKGVEIVFVTLHVGAGTFQPVRVDNILDHKMHYEYVHVTSQVCEKIQAAKQQGKRIFAVGTTSVRSVETAAQQGTIQPYQGETNLFIYPGYQFQCVDAILTNFHLPESTLLMLISAFAGHNTMMQAYDEAVKQRYRFFSYGDAMLIC